MFVAQEQYLALEQLPPLADTSSFQIVPEDIDGSSYVLWSCSALAGCSS